MPDGLKYGLWALGALLLAALGVVLASNLALLFYGAHDGQIHTLTVFSMLTSTNERAASSARLASMVVGGAVVLASFGIWNARNRQSLFGEARWANEREIKQAGLRSKGGLIVGKFGGRYLNFGGQEHLFVSAPTRGGKGVGIVIPNLLNWPGSTIVLDVKKENWEITAGFRQKAGQSVHLFDPLDPEGRTARYNPLGYVNRTDTTQLYDDLQRIAGMLFTADARSGDPFWMDSARTAFIGIAGYVAETEELTFTLGEILRQMNASPKLSEHFMKILESRNGTTRQLSKQCRTALLDFLSGSDKTVQSIRQSVTSKLSLWLNPRIDYATSDNDFDLRELRRQPISIYLGVTPDNLNRLAPLLNLFFQQAVDLNSRVLPEHDKSMSLKVMLMLDEFRALGNVEIINKGVAFLAGYGFRIVTIVQSPAQLRAVYGHDDATNFITNHGVEVVFTPKDLADAKELSERFGFDTVSRKSRSRNLGFSKRNRSESTSEQQRALMLPQELTLTPYEDAYILKAQMRPLKAKKILYFKDPVFKKRILPPPARSPALTKDQRKIEELELRIRGAEARLNERIIREPTTQEITNPVQPADGEDGATWRPEDREDIDEKHFANIVIDNAKPDVHRDAILKGASNWITANIRMPLEEDGRGRVVQKETPPVTNSGDEAASEPAGQQDGKPDSHPKPKGQPKAKTSTPQTVQKTPKPKRAKAAPTDVESDAPTQDQLRALAKRLSDDDAKS